MTAGGTDKDFDVCAIGDFVAALDFKGAVYRGCYCAAMKGGLRGTVGVGKRVECRGRERNGHCVRFGGGCRICWGGGVFDDWAWCGVAEVKVGTEVVAT